MNTLSKDIFDEKDTAIIMTMCMRLSQDNAMIWLKANGFKMGLSTYEQRKSRIKKSADYFQRKAITDGLWAQHWERIMQMETILKNTWEDYHEEKDRYKRAKIGKILAEMQPILSNYYSMNQAIIENDVRLKQVLKSKR